MLSLSKTYSTKGAAKKVGVHWMTLHKWLVAGKIRPSARIDIGGGKHWRWTLKDIAKIKKYKKEHFREGQGRRSEKVKRNK
jgi:predicted site-specific integrase-resolvase